MIEIMDLTTEERELATSYFIPVNDRSFLLISAA